jgi:hypothetical protein
VDIKGIPGQEFGIGMDIEFNVTSRVLEPELMVADDNRWCGLFGR